MTGGQILDLSCGLLFLAFGSLGLLMKDFDFPALGFWSQMIFGKNGTLPRWLGVSFYIVVGAFLIYSAFA